MKTSKFHVYYNFTSRIYLNMVHKTKRKLYDILNPENYNWFIEKNVKK